MCFHVYQSKIFNKWTKSSQKSATKKTGMAARVGADDGLQSQHHLLFQVTMIMMLMMMSVMTGMAVMMGCNDHFLFWSAIEKLA